MTGRVQIVIDGHKFEKATDKGKIFWVSFDGGIVFDDDHVQKIIKSEPDGI